MTQSPEDNRQQINQMMEIKGLFTTPLLVICSTWQTWLEGNLKRYVPNIIFTGSMGSLTIFSQQRIKICFTLIETKIIERDLDKQDKLIRAFDTWLIFISKQLVERDFGDRIVATSATVRIKMRNVTTWLDLVPVVDAQNVG